MIDLSPTQGSIPLRLPRMSLSRSKPQGLLCVNIFVGICVYIGSVLVHVMLALGPRAGFHVLSLLVWSGLVWSSLV